MATNNAINNTSNPIEVSSLIIDPGSSGDSYVQFNINSTAEFRMGIDDDADDAWILSQGNALGTNNTLSVIASGEYAQPLNPAFRLFLGTEDTNVTGQGATYQLGGANALTEVYDQGGNATTGGVFTAPADGVYFFSGLNRTKGGSVSGIMDEVYYNINTSNRVYKQHALDIQAAASRFGASSGQFGRSLSVVADMDSGDTSVYEMVISGGSGNSVDVDDAQVLSWFLGYLVC